VYGWEKGDGQRRRVSQTVLRDAPPGGSTEAVISLPTVAEGNIEQESDQGGEKGIPVPLPWQHPPMSSDSVKTYSPVGSWLYTEVVSGLPGIQREGVEKDLALQRNEKPAACMANACFRSTHFRKIRMTYFDGGEGGMQVFNALFYPDPSLFVPFPDRNSSGGWAPPLLGIDLIKLSSNRYLEVIDVQPLSESAEYRRHVVEKQFTNLKRKFEEKFGGKPSKRFYEGAEFFSDQMLYGRFEDDSHHQDHLIPAVQDYARKYVEFVTSLPSAGSSTSFPADREGGGLETVREALRLHTAHDNYSARRDPAKRVFARFFGDEWSERLVRKFLFDRAVFEDR